MIGRTGIEVQEAGVIQQGNKVVVGGPVLNLVLVMVVMWKSHHQILIDGNGESVRVVAI